MDAGTVEEVIEKKSIKRERIITGKKDYKHREGWDFL